MMIADIANGNTDLADVLFLAAFIVAVLGAVLTFIQHGYSNLVLFIALALVSLGWLVL